jgi:hypothetical protein
MKINVTVKIPADDPQEAKHIKKLLDDALENMYQDGDVIDMIEATIEEDAT